jgi:hypothetical protein
MTESKYLLRRRRNRKMRAQSIVEFALMAPILLIILSALFEFGFIFTHYLAVLDAARNASRFSSDSQYDLRDAIQDCSSTDFYRQTACLAVGELASEQPTITLCLPGTPPSEDCDGVTWDQMDDIIVSVFSVLSTSNPKEVRRFPEEGGCQEWGWSYAADLTLGARNQCDPRDDMHVSKYSSAKVKSLLAAGAPNTGFVLVEINYHYHHILGLPWFTQFVHDPIKFNIYAMWPLVSAEPTNTPK